MGSASDDAACQFIIEHLEDGIGRNLRLLDENAAQLGYPVREQRLDEILLYVHVLKKQFRQSLLVYVAPYAHQGELEESGHRRRHAVNRPAVVADDID